MPDIHQLLKRQQVLGDFGEFAIRSQNLDEVLMEACRLVAEALGTDRSKVLEIQPGREELLVRAGVGWGPNVVGAVRLQMSDRSSETYSIELAQPVVVQDIAAETRFDIPAFMSDAGITSMVNVPIFVPGQRPYGVLQVDDTAAREFGDDEIQFLRTYAMILGPVIDRLHLLDERNAERERIRTSEARHRLLVESWAQAVWEVDANGVVVDDSPSWRAYTGQTLDEWLGDGWLDAVHPEDRTFAEQQWRDAIAAMRNVDADFRLHAPDGGWRWTNVRAAPVLDDEGQVVKWAGMNIDIDARKHAEAALSEREADLMRVQRIGRVGGLDIDVANGLVSRRSPEYLRLHGLGPESRRETHADWRARVHPADVDEAERHLFEVLAGTASTYESVYRVIRPSDGAVRWIAARADIERDHEGCVVRMVGAHLDVTEQRGAEAALRDSEKRQRALIEGVPQLVWRASEPGLWTWASPQWTEFTGQRMEDSRGWGWLEPLHPDDRDAARAAWAHAAEVGQLSVDHRICVRGEGTYRWFQTRATPLRDEDGVIVEWLGTSTDVDDLRRLQDHQHLLVAELQHRTRNLMGVVRSMADKTARSSIDLPDFRTRFRDRLDALARVQGLLSRLNDHDRVTFDELIETELAAMSNGADRVRLEGPRGVRLRSSMVQTLSMAMHELATNAVKYGALGQETGRLVVKWRVANDEVTYQPQLLIDWRESGVDMRVAGSRPSGGGQGRELIEKALPYQLSAKTSYDLEADGVHCTILIPISTTPSTGNDHA
jgi:PAS domain S-box-containing protein